MGGLRFSFPRLPPVPEWCGKNSGLLCAPGGVGCRFWLRLTAELTREDVCGGHKMVLGPRATRPTARVLTSLESQANPAAHSTQGWNLEKEEEKRSLGSDSEPQVIQQLVCSTNTGGMSRDGTVHPEWLVQGAPTSHIPSDTAGVQKMPHGIKPAPLSVLCPGAAVVREGKHRHRKIQHFSKKDKIIQRNLF